MNPTYEVYYSETYKLFLKYAIFVSNISIIQLQNLYFTRTILCDKERISINNINHVFNIKV